MRPRSCVREWEIDALREGKLSVKDEDSSARHVRSCAACAGAIARNERLRALARAIPAAEPNVLELQRIRSRMLGQVATRPAHRPRAFLAAVAAASLLMTLTAWAIVHRFAPAPVASAPSGSSAASSPSERELGPPVPARDENGPLAPLNAKPVGSGNEPAHGATAPREGPRESRRAAVAPHARPASLDASPGEDATDAYAAAVALFHGGDYASASLAFRAFSRAYPREPQVEDATYLDAVALARAGRADAAGAAAEDHLARFPASFHRREASILVARAARDRGDCARARAVLQPWLAPTPDREAEATIRSCVSP